LKTSDLVRLALTSTPSLAVTTDCGERMLLDFIMRQSRKFLLSGTGILSASVPLPVWAQSPGETPTLEELAQAVGELRQELAARDATISAMQQRIAEMESRSGVTAAARTASGTAPAPAQPAPPPVPQARPAPSERQAATAAVAGLPEQAPGQITVDEKAVATALERALVQEGVLLLPKGAVQLEPSFAYARGERSVPALVDGLGEVAVIETQQDAFSAGLAARVGLPLDSQLTVSIPYRFRNVERTTRLDSGIAEERNTSSSGLGDFSVSFSKGLLQEGIWRPNLIASATWDTATGDNDGGVKLGSGFHELTGSLVASKSQDPLVFVGSISFSHSFEDRDFQPGNVIGLSLGANLAASPETSLRFFLDQNFIQDASFQGQTIPGSDENVTIVSIGASSILTSRIFLDVEAGIGLTEAAPDYTFSVSLPIVF
jgi:Putative MetA-pathway of phenol degradation